MVKEHMKWLKERPKTGWKKGQEQKAVDNSKRLQEVKKFLVQQKSQKP